MPAETMLVLEHLQATLGKATPDVRIHHRHEELVDALQREVQSPWSSRSSRE